MQKQDSKKLGSMRLSEFRNHLSESKSERSYTTPIKKRPVRYNTGNQPYVQAAVFRAQLRIPSEQEL